MDGPLNVMDFAIYYKKILLFTTKEEVVSLQWLFGVKLSFIFSAPVHHCLKKKKKGSSLLQGTGTMQAGVVHQHILQLAFRKSSWVFG